MRIERVMGRSYAEASDMATSRFGIETMILSTSKVAGMTELLVAIDGQGSKRKADKVLRPVSRPAPDQVPGQPMAQALPGGAAMVDTIRSELLSLERKLAAIDRQVVSSHRCLSLVEQGIPPAFAERMYEAGRGSSAYANHLLANLTHKSVSSLPDHAQILVVGPPGSGRTTATLQMAHELQRKAPTPRPLVGLRDARPGARERFFLLADLCGLDPSWHSSPQSRSIIDAGALPLEACASWSAGDFPVTKVLCVAATANPLTTRRWLETLDDIAGVVIGFWDPGAPPIGLLAQLAQTGVPLLGVSVSADPRDRLQLPSDEVLQIALEASFAPCVAAAEGQAA